MIVSDRSPQSLLSNPLEYSPYWVLDLVKNESNNSARKTLSQPELWKTYYEFYFGKAPAGYTDYLELFKKHTYYHLYRLQKSLNYLEKASHHLKNDQRFMLKAISIKAQAYNHATDELKENKHFALSAIKKNPWVFSFLNEAYQNNEEIIRLALQANQWIACLLPADSFSNPRVMNLILPFTVVLEYLIQNDGSLLKFVPSDRQTKRLAALAVNQNANNIFFVSSMLQTDLDILRIMCRKDGLMIKHVNMDRPSAMLKEYEILALEAIKQNEEAFELLPEYLINSRNFVFQATLQHTVNKSILLQAINVDVNCFKFAPFPLRNDRDVVLAAVRKCGGMLKYASYQFKSDNEIVKAACKKDPTAIHYASILVNRYAEVNFEALLEERNLDDQLQARIQSLREGVNSGEHTIIDPSLLLSPLLYISPFTLVNYLRHLPEEHSLLTALTDKNLWHFHYQQYFLEKQEENTSYDYSAFRSKVLYLENEVQKGNLTVLANISSTLKKERSFFSSLVSSCPSVIQFADESVQTDHNFIKILCQKNKHVLDYLPDDMKNAVYPSPHPLAAPKESEHPNASNLQRSGNKRKRNELSETQEANKNTKKAKFSSRFFTQDSPSPEKKKYVTRSQTQNRMK